MKAFFYLAILVILISSVVHPQPLTAEVGADLYFNRVETTATTDSIIIQSRVNPNDLNINAVSLQVDFDPKILEIEAVETGYSFCIYWFENTFDNASGTLAIQCGLPTPATSTDSLIAEIHFEKIQEGYSAVDIKENSEVLLNNGLGTNVIKDRFGIII